MRTNRKNHSATRKQCGSRNHHSSFSFLSLLVVIVLSSFDECMIFTVSAAAFLPASSTSHRLFSSKVNADKSDKDSQLPTLTVPITELEKDLTPEEKSVTSVVRNCKRSVAYVTSILPTTIIDNEDDALSRRRNGRGRRRFQKEDNNNNNSERKSNKNGLPQGQGLGSGSAFVIESDGYLVTNYHVVQSAYQIQQSIEMIETNRNSFISNVTKLFLSPLFGGGSSRDDNNDNNNNAINSIVNNTIQTLVPNLPLNVIKNIPKVYVRINEETQYQSCRIVNVKPELDIAVLKIMTTAAASQQQDDTTTTNNTTSPSSSSSDSSSTLLEPVKFGSSDKLIVGQQLVAIGNPFGLDNTVTSGVVSALNRDYPGAVAGNTIRGCIQTDCAINPGNSGGPLLNLNGEVIGVNTAIITTSGSNAGIGFAIPSNDVKVITNDIIRKDRIQYNKRPNMGYLGISIMDTSKLSSSSSSSQFKNDGDNNNNKLWISSVVKNSPADKAGMQPIQISNDTGKLTLGDCIVGIGGRTLDGGDKDDFLNDIQTRVAGEEVSITLENGITNERRVVYVKLE